MKLHELKKLTGNDAMLWRDFVAMRISVATLMDIADRMGVNPHVIYIRMVIDELKTRLRELQVMMEIDNSVLAASVSELKEESTEACSS